MAGWFDNDWKYRLPISIDATAVATGTVDFDVELTKDLGYFWDNVQSNGYDMRLTQWDGITEISASAGGMTDWDRRQPGGTAWNATTRTGGVRVQDYSGVTNSAHNVIWLYFGKESAETTDTTGTPTGTYPQSALVNTLSSRKASPVIRTRPEAPGETTPRVRVSKVQAERLHLFWDFKGELLSRLGIYEGRTLAEGIRSVTVDAYTGGSAGQAVIEDDVLWLDHGMIRTKHFGGSTGTDYTLEVVATTTIGRRLIRRALLQVRDPDDQ